MAKQFELNPNPEYEQFGDDWVKEVKKFPKEDLIKDLLKPAYIRNIDFRTVLEAAKEEFSQYEEAYGTSKCEAYILIKSVLEKHPI